MNDLATDTPSELTAAQQHVGLCLIKHFLAHPEGVAVLVMLPHGRPEEMVADLCLPQVDPFVLVGAAAAVLEYARRTLSDQTGKARLVTRIEAALAQLTTGHAPGEPMRSTIQ